MQLILNWLKWAKNVGRGTSSGYLLPLGKSSASLERIGWEVFGEQWRGMASQGHTSTAQWMVGYKRCPHWMCSGKGGEWKNCILEQPVNNKGCSSIQFLLKEFIKFLGGLESSISWNIRIFWEGRFFSSLG